MLLRGFIAYDAEAGIAVRTTGGRVKYGNKRTYLVYLLTDVWDDYWKRFLIREVFQFRFKAMNDIEAYHKVQVDKRLNALYASLWQREWSQMMSDG